MSWYRRPLAAGQTFRCASCGRVKHVKYVPTSNLCRRCAAKKRRTVPNVPVSLTENIVVTTVVEKRLRKKAEKDIPRTKADIIGEKLEGLLFLPFWVSAPFVASNLFNEYSGPWWVFVLAWCLGLPWLIHVVIDQILAKPRRERMERVASRIQELAEERKKNIEEAQSFYSSPEWVKLREQVIKEEGRVCAQCRRHIKNDNDVTVDHIHPRTKYPHLALSRENLRVLCRRCNSRKKDQELLTILQ